MSVTSQFQSLCHDMFTSPLKWICSALVPEELCRKHKSRKHMAVNAPYSIFQLENQESSYLLFFNNLEISECRTIFLPSLHKVNCWNDRHDSRRLLFGYSLQLCYNHSVDLTTDLKEYCGAKGSEKDLLSGYYFVNDQTDPQLSIYEERGNGCGLLGSPSLGLCLLLSLLLVLFLRWTVAFRFRNTQGMAMNFTSILYFANNEGRNVMSVTNSSGNGASMFVSHCGLLHLVAAALVLLLILRWR